MLKSPYRIGEHVEVFDQKAKIWIAGQIARVIGMADFPDCRRYRCYQVTGFTFEDQWVGRWEENLVRLPGENKHTGVAVRTKTKKLPRPLRAHRYE
jgi:hypothetical protein